MNQFPAFVMPKKISLICSLCGSEIPVPGLKNHTDRCKSRDLSEFVNRMENGNFDPEQNMAKERLQILLDYGEKIVKQLRENSENESLDLIGFHQNL